jgi:hypothetical protein
VREVSESERQRQRQSREREAIGIRERERECERRGKEEAVERKENRSRVFFFSFYLRAWRIRVG